MNALPHCKPKRRSVCDGVATRLDTLGAVDDATTCPPSDGPTDRWSVSILLEDRGAVPPVVALEIAEYNCEVLTVARQGDAVEARVRPVDPHR